MPAHDQLVMEFPISSTDVRSAVTDVLEEIVHKNGMQWSLAEFTVTVAKNSAKVSLTFK